MAKDLMFTPYSIIEENSEIGEGTKVWYFAHIRKGAKIGRNCNIGDYVYIDNDVIIGDNVRIGNGSNIYSGTIIKNNVFIGNGVKFTNVKRPKIGQKGIKKNTIVENEVSIDAGSEITAGVRIGQGSFIAAGSVIIKDIPEYKFVAGNPGVIMKDIKPNEKK